MLKWFNFEKIIWIIFHVKMVKLDGGGNCGFREAIVDILLVESGFQYYFLFC